MTRPVSTAAQHLTDADWYHIHSFWRSSLFPEIYLKDDFQRTKALRDQETGFQTFLAQFLNLCDRKRNEKFHTWNEDQTVHSWILPVLETLGWWDKTSDTVIPELSFTVAEGDKKRTFRPDCSILASPKLKSAIQEREASDRLEYARRYVILALEAKFWDRIRSYEKSDSVPPTKADTSKARQSDSASSLSPGGQILTYLKYLRNDDPPRNHFGVVTDGKVWRLHHVDRPEDKFFEFDLGKLYFEITKGKEITDLTGKQYQHIEEAARYFYFLFSKYALYSDKNEPTLVDDLFEYSRKYVAKAEENLKRRFITAMRHACNGLYRSFKEQNQKLDLPVIRDVAESYIFNILFLKSCEAKGVIRYEANTDVSITSIIERISHFDPNESVDDDTNEEHNLRPAFREFHFSNSGYDLHKKIMKLTALVQNGGRLESGIEIPAFKESVFSETERSLIERCPLSNIETVKLLHELGYMEEDGKPRQIPYSAFTPEQLGSIYESFLEFTLLKADEDLEFVKKQWVPLTKKTADQLSRRETVRHPIARKGELFFTPDNKDRKASGSYYTPDHVVKYIVDKTLTPLCQGKSSSEILKLRVCDPAMGSGHFLTGALRFLATRYLESLENEPAGRQRTLPQAKRDVLEACIYGVDLNYRAVRLAKLALWLETAHSGTKLERLDDQIRSGDSLIDDSRISNRAFLWSSLEPCSTSIAAFDAVIGNPPYGLIGSDQKQLRDHLISRFKLSHFKTNLYLLFLERGMQLLKAQTGALGFIIPKSLVFNTYFADSRKELLRSFHISHIVEIAEKVFEDAEVGDSILFFATNGRPKGCLLQYDRVPNVRPGDKSSESFTNSQDALLETGNFFETEGGITSNLTFGDVFEIANGLNPGNVRHLLLSDSKKGAKYRKLLLGRDIQRYKISWSGTWVNYDPTLKDRLTVKDIRSKKGMTAQKKVDFALRSERIFPENKIVVRKTADHIVAALDSSGYYYDSLSYALIPKSKRRESMLYVLGLLNSSLMNEQHSLLSNNKNKVFAKVLAANLCKLPYLEIDFSDSEQAALHKGIEDRVRKLLLGDTRGKYQDELDNLVRKLQAVKSKKIKRAA